MPHVTLPPCDIIPEVRCVIIADNSIFSFRSRLEQNSILRPNVVDQQKRKSKNEKSNSFHSGMVIEDLKALI